MLPIIVMSVSVILFISIIIFVQANKENIFEFNKYNLTKTTLRQLATCEVISNNFTCRDPWGGPYIIPAEPMPSSGTSKTAYLNISKVEDNFNFIDTIIEKHKSNNVILSKAIQDIPRNNSCIKNEPSVASNGTFIFYTGNHYASRSQNNGTDWNFMDPAWRFPFCCDQRVIYNENNGIFIWYSQGERNRPEYNANYVRLAVSKDLSNWDLYIFSSTMINDRLRNSFLDFPNLATDNTFLYLTSNLLNLVSENDPTNKGSMILRIPLEKLREVVEDNNFQDISAELFHDYEARTITPVKGATAEMYLATILKEENEMRIYNLNQSSYLKQYDISIHEFVNLKRNGTLDCGLNNTRWGWTCGSIDSKITTGWIDNDKIGFLWHANRFVKNENIEAVPYIDGAIFDVNDNMKEVARPYIANSHFSFAFADVAFNGDGKLGIITFYGNKTIANLSFGTYDEDINPHWKMMSLLNSTEKITGPLFDPEFRKCYSDAQRIDKNQYQWGDYITINKFPGNDSLWEIAGYIMNTDDWHGAQPYYILVKSQ